MSQTPDSSTVDARTSHYLLALALGVAVVSGGYALARALGRRGWGAPARQGAALLTGVAVLAVVLPLLADPADPGAVPADLLWDFRVRSLLVQAVDHWHEPSAALMRPFRQLPDWRMDDLMISFSVPGGGVGPHLDQYDVFIIQGTGRRRWRVGEKTPLKQHCPHPDLLQVELCGHPLSVNVAKHDYPSRVCTFGGAFRERDRLDERRLALNWENTGHSDRAVDRDRPPRGFLHHNVDVRRPQVFPA